MPPRQPEGNSGFHLDFVAARSLRAMRPTGSPRPRPDAPGGWIDVALRIWLFAVLAFMLVYGGTMTTMTMLLAASGLDIVTAFTAVVASLNNMGPGLGQVGPTSNYAVLNDFQTWVCTASMLLGRLELFSILVVFTPAFWRK